MIDLLAQRRFDAIVLGTFVDLIDTLKSQKSKRCINSTNSVAAARQRLDRIIALQRMQMLGQRTRVHPDTHRRPRRLGPRHDLGDLVRTTDVARIQPNAMRARIDRLQRQRMVEMNIGDDRNRRLHHDRLQRLDIPITRHRHPHDVRTRLARPCGSAPSSPTRFAVSVFVIVCTATGAPPPIGNTADHDLSRGAGRYGRHPVSVASRSHGGDGRMRSAAVAERVADAPRDRGRREADLVEQERRRTVRDEAVRQAAAHEPDVAASGPRRAAARRPPRRSRRRGRCPRR